MMLSKKESPVPADLQVDPRYQRVTDSYMKLRFQKYVKNGNTRLSRLQICPRVHFRKQAATDGTIRI